ncbi:hypothetical protein [Arsukibacterium ikkense]|uniref:hypothetical protein n=1 Tax=Arsukibacterium ikkense TaxID=336831 RepID=UPI00069C0DDE|nr:hypothetical protein [Arsukibacterium ikkense]
MKLHVVFTTTSLTAANELIFSIQNTLIGWDLSFHALLIGADDVYSGSAALHNALPFNLIDCKKSFLSIHESRNICQVFLHKQMVAHGGLGIVLDDDLKWVMREADFSKLISDLIEQNCDMAFSALLGDSPIPKEYTRASPLLDVLLALSEEKEVHLDSKVSAFLQSVSVADTNTHHLLHWHHDYYSYRRDEFQPACLDVKAINWQEFFRALLVGKETTRPVRIRNDIFPATGRERGGATLIFNPAVLLIKNSAIVTHNMVSRRSDMLMGVSAKSRGFRLFNTAPLLKHERKESFDTHDIRKLTGDILGYALVETYCSNCCSYEVFSKHLSERLNRTEQIIKDTNLMLKLISRHLFATSCLTIESQTLVEMIYRENLAVLNEFKKVKLASLFSDFINWFQLYIVPSASLNQQKLNKDF